MNMHFSVFFLGSGVDVSVSRAMLCSGSHRLDTIGIGRINHAAVVGAYLALVLQSPCINVDAEAGAGIAFVLSVKGNDAISNS